MHSGGRYGRPRGLLAGGHAPVRQAGQHFSRVDRPLRIGASGTSPERHRHLAPQSPRGRAGNELRSVPVVLRGRVTPSAGGISRRAASRERVPVLANCYGAVTPPSCPLVIPVAAMARLAPSSKSADSDACCKHAVLGLEFHWGRGSSCGAIGQPSACVPTGAAGAERFRGSGRGGLVVRSGAFGVCCRAAGVPQRAASYWGG